VAGAKKSGIKTRLMIYRGLLALAFLALVGQLWRLQMIRGDYYQEAADVNRFRLEQNPAPRGVIYDRRGYLLARNMPQITVSIIPGYLPEDEVERRALLLKLADLIDLPVTSPPPARLPKHSVQPAVQADPEPEPGILDIYEEAQQAPYRPALLKSGVSREVAMTLEEEHLDWPGVLVQVEAVREYLYSPLTSHLLGYMGPIPEEQVEDYEAQGYDPSRHKVGLMGIEYTFEDELSGQDGQKLVEVDVAGREVRTVGEPATTVPGHNLQLALDLDLQRAIEEILTSHLKSLYKQQGVVVALNPQTGEVLSMVSLPSYDNNEFTGGISAEALKKLQEDANRPLVNHAISGMFPPGSTFKIIVASGGLEEQVITTDSRLYCGGILWLPNRYYPEDPSLAQPFYCWIHQNGGRHGSLGIVAALGQSCDIFFYQLGGGYRNQFAGLGEERVGYYAELLGLGARTGIDLPGEAPGLVPNAKWKRVNYSESWVTGDTYNMSIGQGFVLATPLQMVNAVAAIANGGTLYRPQLVHEIRDGEGNVVRAFTPDVIRRLPVSTENINIVRQGLRAAVAGPGATAWALNVPGVAVAGKTGTAEFFIDRNKDGLADRDREGNLPTHAWFLSFAPYENPEIALAVFIYGGGEGSAAAVPVASEILNYYFGRDRVESTP
jgi:penicillin-binding protein 2